MTALDAQCQQCVPNVMNKLKHFPTHQPQNSSYPARCIEHGKKIQTPLPEDKNPLLPYLGVTFMQNTIGVALCLDLIIDSTLLVA